jgi:hypothetical protein
LGDVPCGSAVTKPAAIGTAATAGSGRSAASTVHDLEAGSAVGERLRAVAHRDHELLRLDEQRLRVGDLGGDDVARPVRELELAEVRRLAEVDAVVEDLDLLDALGVVVDEHLLAADHHRPAQLDRREPRYLHLGDHSARVPQVDEGDVGQLGVDARPARHRDARRRLAEPVSRSGVVRAGSQMTLTSRWCKPRFAREVAMK